MTAAAVRAGLEALARSALDSAALAEQVASVARRYAGTLRSGRTLFFWAILAGVGLAIH